MTSFQTLSFKQIPQLQILRETYPGLQGLFFDMDGTLFNTEKIHAEALQKIGHDYHIEAPVGPDEVYQLMVGKADHLLFEIIKNWKNFPQNWTVKDFVEVKNNNLLSLLKSVQSSDFIPVEMKRLLIEARTAGLYIALVTSSEKVITMELLKLAGLDNFFDLILTRDDCPRHKPDPWPYIEALNISQKIPSSILILEDSSVGLTAAKASGAHVIKAQWYDL
jgi:beta-phosphoglucomutase-like phosphatase (HAD superfamily)